MTREQGISLVLELIDYYSLKVVQQYMKFVRSNAESAVRTLLKNVAAKSGKTLLAEDFMDDGTAIRLKVTINAEEGSAIFDFSYVICLFFVH